MRKDLNVVFVSGYGDSIATLAGKAGPCDQVLGKPFKPQQLADAVRCALDC